MKTKQDCLIETYKEIMSLYHSNDVVKLNEKLHKLLALAKELESHYYYASALNILGAVQSLMGNLSRAIDFYFDAMNYAEKYKVYEILPVVYSNIASRYIEADEYETALVYLKKLEEIEKMTVNMEHTDPRMKRQRTVIFNLNFALVYTRLKEYEKSNEYVDKVDQIIDHDVDADLKFAGDFLRFRNQYYMGNAQYVEDNLNELVDRVDKLKSLYSYENNIDEMFTFLMELGRKEQLQHVLNSVEKFIKEQNDDADCQLMYYKMSTKYLKKYGDVDAYREDCVKLAQLYEEKEKKSVQERKEYTNLRMKMKIFEDERMEEEEKQKNLLATALKDAEQANVAKSEFLSRMSHEIRTPLNAVIGYITMAQNNLDDKEKLNDYHQKSQVAAKHLLSIINDVLDVSAIASGHFKIENAAFDFKQIVFEINSMFKEQAMQKDIHFSVELKHLDEELLVGDSLRTKQILLNLLSNAMKFTPKDGRITLLIEQSKLEAKNQSKVEMKFMVADTGVGMTKEFLDRMFVPFEQQDASISRKYGGTGLGLSISHQLAEMMGGSIDVTSEEQVGTTFVVTIPFEVAELQEEIELSGCDFSKLRALIVTENAGAKEELKSVFKRIKLKSDIVEDGAKALRQLEIRKGGSYEYGICLIDQQGDNASGLKLVQEIREQYEKDLFVVLLTDCYSSSLVKEAEAVGFNHVIEKPLFQSTLLDILMSEFGNREKTFAKDTEKVDFSGMHVLLAEDNEMNMEIAEDILTRANLKVDKAVDGRQAWEMFVKAKPGTYHAILMDIQMPEMDGYEATKAIRNSEHEEATSIPIIALTANAFQEDVKRAIDAGMNGHIAKPINIKELYEVLGKQLAHEK